MVPWLFLLPSLLFVSIMVLIPMLDALRRSFFLAAGDRFVGFQNYLSVLRNHAFQLAAANTARFILVCIPLLLLFSLAVSLMLASFREKRGIFKTSFLVPMAVPVASIVLLWRVIFHKMDFSMHLLHFGVWFRLTGLEVRPPLACWCLLICGRISDMIWCCGCQDSAP